MRRDRTQLCTRLGRLTCQSRFFTAEVLHAWLICSPYCRRTPIEQERTSYLEASDGEHCTAFEAEFRAVLVEVAATFDVDRLSQVMRCWRPGAVLDAHPDPIAEYIGQRLRDGDQSVLTKTAAELWAEMVNQDECATR